MHLALAKETRGFIGADLLAHARPGMMLINTARGEVVDYAALADAVRDKGLRVGLDVFANEPSGAEGQIDDPILSLPGRDRHASHRCVHRSGAGSDRRRNRPHRPNVRRDRHVPNVVNLAKKTPATHMLVVRHLDKPGVLAHVFERLRDAHLNVQETENIIFDGAHAAVARINLDGEPAAAGARSDSNGQLGYS